MQIRFKEDDELESFEADLGNLEAMNEIEKGSLHHWQNRTDPTQMNMRELTYTLVWMRIMISSNN